MNLGGIKIVASENVIFNYYIVDSKLNLIKPLWLQLVSYKDNEKVIIIYDVDNVYSNKWLIDIMNLGGIKILIVALENVVLKHSLLRCKVAAILFGQIVHFDKQNIRITIETT